MPDITSNLVGHWPAQDNAASTVVVGTVGGNCTLVGGDNTSVKSVAGPGGAYPLALALNGTDDVIDTGATSVGGVDLFADTDNWSFGLWLKTVAQGTVAAKASATAGNRTFQMFIGGAGIKPGVILRGTQTNFGAAIDDGAWHHWLITWNGTAAALYKNGTSVGTPNVGVAVIEAQNIKFGARTTIPAVFLAGSFADIRMYSRALAAEDAVLLATLQLPTPRAMHQSRQRQS